MLDLGLELEIKEIALVCVKGVLGVLELREKRERGRWLDGEKKMRVVTYVASSCNISRERFDALNAT